MSSLNINLLTIGASETVDLGFVEQVSALLTVNTITGGVTATRQLIQEFRHSTDGTFSGPFIALNNSQISALVLDPDNRLYLQLRYTRDGTDATGIIQVHRTTFSATFDPNAIMGHGAFTTAGIYEEVHELLIGIMENHVLQNGGKPAYKVQDFDFDFTPNVQKPIIYVASVDTSQSAFDTLCSWQYNCTARIGIQRRISRDFNYQKQISAIQGAFNPRIGFQFGYNLTFKNVVFTNSNLRDLGLSDITVGPIIELKDPNRNIKWAEFGIAFSIAFQSPFVDSLS